jgi:hypothetical protein
MKSYLPVWVLMVGLCFSTAGVSAQCEKSVDRKAVKPQWKLAIEYGTNEFFGNFDRPSQLRQTDGDSYGGDYDYGFDLYGLHYNNGRNEGHTLYCSYIGLKPEVFFMDGQLGIASGLRWYRTDSELKNDKALLWRHSEEKSIRTDYFQLQSIERDFHLLGVPLEVRFFPGQIDREFQHYIKIGTVFNFCVADKVSVNFENPEMKEYEKKILNELPSFSKFSAYSYAAIGCKVGKTRQGKWSPWGNIELQYPCLLYSGKSFGFNYNGVASFGFQLSLQIPLGTATPIGSCQFIEY